jgi:serine/threonine-protein kinase RsbW
MGQAFRAVSDDWPMTACVDSFCVVDTMSSRPEHVWNKGTGRIRRLRVKLESSVQSADRAESMIVEFCGQGACGQREREEVGLAVRESVANAVLHGNRCDRSKKILMTAELTDNRVVISIQDEGEGFDPGSLPDPLVSDNLLNETGRGLFLVKTCVDDVILRRAETRGMEVTLIKYVSKTSPRRIPQ